MLKVHRLVVVDEEKRVTGIISLSDILTYIVLKQDEPTRELLANKTASLTTAFGLTRLNSLNLSNSNGESMDGVQQVPKTGNSNGNGFDLSSSNLDASSLLTANLNQPQSVCVDQAIFEDDPMETETQKWSSTFRFV